MLEVSEPAITNEKTMFRQWTIPAQPVHTMSEAERRTDPEGGDNYTFQELLEKYKENYSEADIKTYWDNTCQQLTTPALARAAELQSLTKSRSRSETPPKDPEPPARVSFKNNEREEKVFRREEPPAQVRPTKDRSPVDGGKDETELNEKEEKYLQQHAPEMWEYVRSLKKPSTDDAPTDSPLATAASSSRGMPAIKPRPKPVRGSSIERRIQRNRDEGIQRRIDAWREGQMVVSPSTIKDAHPY